MELVPTANIDGRPTRLIFEVVLHGNLIDGEIVCLYLW